MGAPRSQGSCPFDASCAISRLTTDYTRDVQHCPVLSPSFPLVLTAHRGAHVSVVNSDIRFRFASAALRASHRISSHRISSRRRGLCHCVTVSIRRPKQLTALLPFECRENENEFAEKTKESASSEHFVPVLKSVAAAVALWRFLFEEIR